MCGQAPKKCLPTPATPGAPMSVEDAMMSGCDGCLTCPFTIGEEAEQAQNYGCLPTPHEILDMARQSGRPWGCHDGSGRVCHGYASVAKNLGLATTGDAIDYEAYAHHGAEAAMRTPSKSREAVAA